MSITSRTRAVGRHAVPDPAGDPVPLVIGWITVEHVLFGGYLATRSSCSRCTTCSVTSKRSSTVPRGLCCTRSPACPCILCAAGALSAWWYLYIKRPDLPPDRDTRLRALQAAVEQVLLRRDLPGRVRRRPRPRHALWRVGDVALIDGRNGQRLGARGRLALRPAASHAVGLPLSLRVRDDHRIVRAARVVRAATRTRTPCSWTGPSSAYSSGCRSSARGHASLGDRGAALGRWVALHDGRGTFGISTLLWTASTAARR